MASNSTSQADIARKLGLSRSHVAGVLSGNSQTTASDEVRRRILETATEMGYVPNAAARMLRSGKTFNIVLIYANPHDLEFQPHNAPLIQVVAEAMGQYGYKLEVKSCESNNMVLDALKQIVRSKSSDAVILSGVGADVAEQADLLHALNHAFVALGQFPTTSWVQADFDHAGMMRQTMNKLVELGHRRIAYLGHHDELAYARRYHEAFVQFTREMFGTVVPDSWELISRENVHSQEQIMEQVDSWMELPVDERPTALACGEGGSILIPLEMHLISHGLRIGEAPGEFAFAGFYGAPEVKLITGASWSYRYLSVVDLFQNMVRRQLLPIARGEEPEVVKMLHLPALTREASTVEAWDARRRHRASASTIAAVIRERLTGQP